jgi:very-short-patch-repair endonuclease
MACYLKWKATPETLRRRESRTCERDGCDQPLNRKQKQFCSPQCRNIHFNKLRVGPKTETAVWSKEDLAYLIANYPDHGCAAVAKTLGRSHDQVMFKANRLKLGLTESSRRRIVHDRAAEHMREDNPSRRPGATERLRRQTQERPHIVKKMMEGQARIQKDKPSKLEMKLAAMLDSLRVTYEQQVLIKDKFIVDFRVGMLVIEADGGWWHGHPRFEPLNPRQVRQQKRDAARDKYLTVCGYTVVRIWDSDMKLKTVRGVIESHEEMIHDYLQL